MAIYQFPTGGFGSPFQKLDSQAKVKQQESGCDFQQEFYKQSDGQVEVEEVISNGMQNDQFKVLMENTYPLTWRLATFFGSLCLFFGCVFFFMCSVFSWIVSCLTFQKIASLNAKASEYGSKAKKMFVFFIALFIASFSPALGLGMLVVYSAMTGSSLSNVFLSGLSGLNGRNE